LVQIVREWICSCFCINTTKIELLNAFPKETGSVFRKASLIDERLYVAE